MVGLQIQQSTDLVRAELDSNVADAWIAIDASKQGEAFAAVLAKSVERPQELTTAEILWLDGYLFSYIDQLVRDRQLYNEGIFDNPPEALVRGSLHDYFGNELSRAWWAETKWKFNREIVEVIDQELPNISASQDLEYIEQFKSRLGKLARRPPVFACGQQGGAARRSPIWQTGWKHLFGPAYFLRVLVETGH